MKKVGDIFQELGFNAHASDEVKIAFIKNLVRAAYGVEVAGPQKPQTTTSLNSKKEESKKLEQLSFDFGFASDVDLKKAN